MMNRPSDPTAKSIGVANRIVPPRKVRMYATTMMANGIEMSSVVTLNASRRLSADTNEGNAQSIKRFVKIQAHVNRGSRMRDIPGARRRKIVTRKFTVDTMLEAMRSMRASPIIEPPTAGLNSVEFNGAYVVHPQSAVPPVAKKLDRASRPLER